MNRYLFNDQLILRYGKSAWEQSSWQTDWILNKKLKRKKKWQKDVEEKTMIQLKTDLTFVLLGAVTDINKNK